MPLKRPAATSAASKAKRQQVESPFASKCGAIMSVLTEAEGYPEATLQMLASSVQSCFGTPKDSRHMVQNAVIDMISEVLASIEANHVKKINELKTKIAEADAEKARRQAVADAAAVTRTEKAEAAKAAEVALEEMLAAEATATTESQEAQAQQKIGDAELSKAESRKVAAEDAMSKAFEPLKDGSAQDIAGSIDIVINVGKDLAFEEQLLSTATHVLGKPASERAAFDGVVMQQMEEQLKNAIGKLSAQLASGEAAKAERASTVQAAQDKLSSFSQQALTCREQLERAKTDAKESVAASKAALKAVQDLDPEIAEASANAELAECVLVAFKADLETCKERCMASLWLPRKQPLLRTRNELLQRPRGSKHDCVDRSCTNLWLLHAADELGFSAVETPSAMLTPPLQCWSM